jgi:hypothetical protein
MSKLQFIKLPKYFLCTQSFDRTNDEGNKLTEKKTRCEQHISRGKIPVPKVPAR